MESDDKDLELDLEIEEEETEKEEPDWKAEALKYKSIAKRYKNKVQNPVARQESEIKNPEPTKTVGVSDEVIDLRLDGYTKDEVEFIIKNGGRKAMEDKTSYVSIAINTRREQSRAESAAESAKDTSQMTEAERKYTPEQMKNMSAAELAKILPHA